jgi:prepilin-type processing-associated H-X9-DG protein
MGMESQVMKSLTNHTLACTRIEMLAVLTTVLLLGFAALPTAANNRGQSRSLHCLSNLRHLIFAWQLYATDHDGVLVGNYTGGEAINTNPKTSPWAIGWLDWNLSNLNTNTNYLRDQRFARLADYILTKRNVHKCPADNFQSPQQRSRGMHRVRSVAMNGTIGGGNALTGPWDPIYRQARTLADLQFPTPAETTIIFDEHPDSINDPFAYSPMRTQWIDVPGNLHNGAGSFSFGDGHVELHQWHTPTLRNLPVRFSFMSPIVRIGDPDIAWMNFSSQRRDSTSF